MLEVALRQHRQCVMAQTPGQKLFLALKVRPAAGAATARPQLSVVYAVDTSGSMREQATPASSGASGGQSKMDLVTAALQGLVDSNQLLPDDHVGLVKFDTQAACLVPLVAAREREQLAAAIASLHRYSGGTQMGAGMEEGLKLLASVGGSRRLVVLTDGQTFDEDLVRQTAERSARDRIAVTAIGVGQDWNEELLTQVTDRTQGRPYHVVPDAEVPQAPSVRASELPRILLDELQQAAREVVTNLGLLVHTTNGVSLDRLTRVYPTVNEADPRTQPTPLGNAAYGDWTVFLLEFTLPERASARMRVARLGLTYQVPGAGYTGEHPPLDVIVEYTNDPGAAGSVDHEVQDWVRQRSIDSLISDALRQAQTSPAQAAKTLRLAGQMTVSLGNSTMTQAIERAARELETGGAITAATAKTVKIGAKTQTIRAGETPGLPSESEIRKLTGA